MLKDPEIQLRGGPRNLCGGNKGSWYLEKFKTTGTAHENALLRFRDVNTDIHSLSYKKEVKKDTIERGLPLLRTARTITVTPHPPFNVFVLCFWRDSSQ